MATIFRVDKKADAGLFYVRTWLSGRDAPFEHQYTSLKEAEAAVEDAYKDRANVRIELLESCEWMTRTITKNSQ